MIVREIDNQNMEAKQGSWLFVLVSPAHFTGQSRAT